MADLSRLALSNEQLYQLPSDDVVPRIELRDNPAAAAGRPSHSGAKTIRPPSPSIT